MASLKENSIFNIFGYVVSTSADLSERILGYMNSRELEICARVCTLWMSTARRLKNKRHGFVHCFETLRRKRKASCQGECSKDLLEKTPKTFLQSLSDSWSEPRQALVFGTPSMYRVLTSVKLRNDMRNKGEGRGRRRRGPAMCVGALLGAASDRLALHLPRGCSLMLGAAEGVVGMDADGSLEVERGEAASGLLLPTLLPDGVRARPFVVTRSQLRCNDDPSDWYATDYFKSIVGLPVGDEALDVKCILWFTVADYTLDEEDEQLFEMINDFVASCGASRFALGGAVLDHLGIVNRPGGTDELCVCGGYCFSGDAVRAASTILGPSVRGEQSVEEELTKFKQACDFDNWDKANSIGFMFACVARGIKQHGKHNVEADAFSRVFPGVPLMGAFGNGEIGVEYVPNKKPPETILNQPCLHGYTTVFVLLSLGGNK